MPAAYRVAPAGDDPGILVEFRGTRRDARSISRNRYLRRLALQGTDVVYTITAELMLLPLESLDLSDTSITDATLEKLARIETLSELRLVGTRITDAGLLELRKLQNLRKLSVSIRNGVTTAGLKRLIAHLPACEIEYTDASGTVKRVPVAGRK